jgi:hypothetical protein
MNRLSAFRYNPCYLRWQSVGLFNRQPHDAGRMCKVRRHVGQYLTAFDEKKDGAGFLALASTSDACLMPWKC